MKMTYDKSIEGHCRGKKISLRLAENFYQSNILQNCKNQFKICKSYQKIKTEKAEKYGKLILVELSKRV